MKRIFISLLAAIAISSEGWAQSKNLDDQDVIDIEGLYNTPAKAPPKTVQQTETVTTTTTTTESTDAATLPPPLPEADLDPEMETPASTAKAKQQPKADRVERLTDLNKLAPFSEISVIQKKYLPKTERLQLYVAPGMTTNSPWFLNLGAKVNLGYHFTESIGIELSGVFLSNSEREVAKEIRTNNGLQPEKFVNTKSYIGVDFFWAPIYGKISFINERIVPFDMYFSAGGGSSTTNSVEGAVPTFHAGTGQIFAISKSMAFRWDYSWTHFSATAIGSAGKSDYDDLILTAGLSFFFPEAEYR